jgi:hypothetical protein
VVPTIRQILLVGKHKDDGIAHLTIVDNPMELLARLVYTITVSTVHYKDETLRAGVVMPP